jgi:hypothetical protein
MKRFIIVFIVAVSAMGLATAQRGPGFGQSMPLQANRQAQPTASSIEGKLIFVNDAPAVQTKDKTFYIEWPNFYYYAYKDSIKDGAQVKLDGYEFPTLPGQDNPYFAVTKAVINGKTYDLTAPGNRPGGMMGGRGMMNGRGMMDNNGTTPNFGRQPNRR